MPPYPDARYKAGVRAFPKLVRWSTRWNGRSFLALGVRDPVRGAPARSSCLKPAKKPAARSRAALALPPLGGWQARERNAQRFFRTS
jgi:hypothetical protein